MPRTNASTGLYSLIETARANGIAPYARLGTVLTKLAQVTSVDEIKALLPAPKIVQTRFKYHEANSLAGKQVVNATASFAV